MKHSIFLLRMAFLVLNLPVGAETLFLHKKYNFLPCAGPSKY